MSSESSTPTSTRYQVVRTPGRYAVLLNARAKGWNGSIHHAIQRYISPGDLFLTEDFHQARRTVDRVLASNYDAIFTAGGDGTIMYLVNALEQRIREGEIAREKCPPVGILRLGTGNAIATYLGCDDILEDLRALRAGAPLSIHTVNMLEGDNQELFPFAGLGWDADILNDYDTIKSMVRDTVFEPYVAGLGGYSAAIASKTIPRAVAQEPVHIRIFNRGERALRIDYDGNVLDEHGKDEMLFEGHVRICGCSSIPYWGFQVRMFPHADRYPDFFQLRAYHGSVRELLVRLPDFWLGRFRESSICDLLVQQAQVEIVGEAVPYQISGDAAGVERLLSWKLAEHPVRLAVPLKS